MEAAGSRRIVIVHTRLWWLIDGWMDRQMDGWKNAKKCIVGLAVLVSGGIGLSVGVFGWRKECSSSHYTQSACLLQSYKHTHTHTPTYR